jgi:hypothetical protein
MTASSWAGVITAIATVLTAAGGLVAAIRLLIPILHQTKEVHKIVNQQRTDMMRYQRALEHALKHAGIALPIDQSGYDQDEPHHELREPQ